MIGIEGSNEQKMAKLRLLVKNDVGTEGLKEIEELLSYVNEDNVVFNVSLARGLSYYTGPVFEVFLKDSKKFGSSLAAGGRWDKMIQYQPFKNGDQYLFSRSFL